jgi:hypothetical protein
LAFGAYWPSHRSEACCIGMGWYTTEKYFWRTNMTIHWPSFVGQLIRMV